MSAKPSLQMKLLSPALLHPNPWNVNKVSPENEAKIEESIKRYADIGGMFKPIIARQLEDGTMQILGGEHRWRAASKLGLTEVPVVNVGRISDERAKEISLVDNARYGSDDTLRLAELLNDLGDLSELTAFMPYTDAEFASIFSAASVDLDSLNLPEDDDTPVTPSQKATQTHQILRFKVPVEDAETVTAAIEKVMKTQKFNQEDSLTNAGHALVWIIHQHAAA